MNHESTENTGMNSFIVGVALLLLAVFLLFYFALPALRTFANSEESQFVTQYQVEATNN